MPEHAPPEQEAGRSSPTAVDADSGASDPDARRRNLLVVAALAVVALVVAFVIDLRSDGHPAPPPGSWTLVPYTGLGAWVDVYDWTLELTDGRPTVDVDSIDAMAESGVQTVFVQVAHNRSAAPDVIEPDRLGELIDRAHERDMHVVAWYLPTLVEPAADLRRLRAAAELPVDGLAVDIEAVVLEDPAERTRRLLELSDELRAAVPADRPLGAITLSSVHTEVVNPAFWPGYPWAELGRRYDVILPMAYWSIRRDELRSGARYIGENIDRIRALAGPAVPVHPIGGIADEVSVADVEGMLAALTERGAVGASLYDWATAAPELWAALAPARSLRTD